MRGTARIACTLHRERVEREAELAEGQAEGVDESEDSLQLEENMEGLEGGPPAVLV